MKKSGQIIDINNTKLNEKKVYSNEITAASAIANMECDVMYKNEVTGHLVVRNGKVNYKAFTNDIHKILFPADTLGINILRIILERVIPACRCDSVMLDYFGLEEYDAYEIFKQTHGIDIDDFKWFRFAGESLTWDDVRVR